MNKNLLELPKKLIQQEQLLRTVAVFDRYGNLIEKAENLVEKAGDLVEEAGDLSKYDLIFLAGNQIATHQNFHEKLGWRKDFWQQSVKSYLDEFCVLLKVQEFYLFLLTYPCQQEEVPQFWALLNSLKSQNLSQNRQSLKATNHKKIGETKVNSKILLSNIKLVSSAILIILIPIAGLTLSILEFPLSLQIYAILVFASLLSIALLSIYLLIAKQDF